MKSVAQAIAGGLVGVACLAAQSAWAQGFTEAHATLVSCSTGAVVGAAALVEKPSPEGIKNVSVMVSATGLLPGKHAVHIHEVASCAATISSTGTPVPCGGAGSHLDLGPFGSNLPVIANHPYHSGDLINLPIGSSGAGSMTHVTSRVALSPGNLSIFDGNGSAIIVHAAADTYCDANPGDANCAGGGRVACGIIVPGKAK